MQVKVEKHEIKLGPHDKIDGQCLKIELSKEEAKGIKFLAVYIGGKLHGTLNVETGD